MQAGLQSLEQLAPELAASTAHAMGTPGVAQPPGPPQEAGPSHDSEQPSGEQPEVRACYVKLHICDKCIRVPIALDLSRALRRPGPYTIASSPQTSPQTTSGECVYLPSSCFTY